MALWDAYYAYMHELHGRPVPPHQYAGDTVNWHKTFWPTAELCYDKQWDPQDYVINILERLTINRIYIKPACLRDPERQDQYQKQLIKTTVDYDIDSEWHSLIEELLSYMADGSSENSVLLSPMTPFPAWFRLVYPERLDEQVFGLYGAAGRKEFAANRRLRDFVRKESSKTFTQLEERWGRFGDLEVLVT
jgi:hypothetical protein